MKELKIEYISIKDLKPYKRNAKQHPKEQIEQIKKSIEEFGMNDPIAVWKDNEIIEGHGRLIACQQLGIDTVPIIRLDDLTDEQRKAYMLVHNKLTMNTDFDLELLNSELSEITDINMEDFGFDLEEKKEENPEPHEDDYDVDMAQPEPVAKYGDIWKLGEHRLMCGDSTKAEDVGKLMDGELADLVVTDPPYNVKYGTQKCQGQRQIKNDNMSKDSFFLFCKDAFHCMNIFLKDTGAFYIWYGSTSTFQVFSALLENGLKPRAPLTWVKDHMVLDFNDYHSQNEPCIYSWKGTNHYFTKDRTQKTLLRDDTPDIDKMKKEEMADLLKQLFETTDIIHEKKPQKSDLHPTMKPITLIARLINNSSHAGELVLDLFGGSGSTMIACEQTKRRCNMMELDPHYCDVIIDRWETFTGKKAEKIS